MLKRVAILAVFLAVTQAPASVSRQTTNSSAQNSQNKKQTANTNSPSPPPLPIVSPPNTVTQQVGTEAKSGKPDEPKTVAIREFPAVSVSKGWEDWLLWAAQLVLTAVGVAGIIYARHTLRILRQQALSMRRQTTQMRVAADAAKKSADAAKISADIATTVSVPTLVVCEFGTGNVGAADERAFLQSPKVKMSIKNYGQTPAFLKWWTLCFSCEVLPETPVYGGPADGIILDKIVVEPNDTFTLPELFWPHRQMLSDEDVEAIIQRKKTLHAYGYICYGDIFGNPLRQLKFCETVLNIFGGEMICDWWEGFAPPAYTGVGQFPISELFDSEKPAEQKPEETNIGHDPIGL